ncbi:hypothetical protein CDAR_287291 [Caerostris darwini]|uniref:Uncharacterized protein n=1 Tax=Caerostris darwini TaxID=1538125 RepID=A0AAV4SK42_9ARAC|nr:hypothetical protein CDAR_287291 [Caerostris darwini]
MTEESDLDASILPIEEDNTDSSDENTMELDCESMVQALAFYNNIFEHTDNKELKKKIKKSIRVNALAIVKIVASQNTYIAQLEGRVQAMEKNTTDRTSLQQALITEAVAKEVERKFPALKDISRILTVAKVPSTVSYADRVKSGTTTESSKTVIKNKVSKKHITTVKPKVETSSSAETRKLVQAKLDIRKLKIGVKQVRNIRNGGIIIETDTDTDLDKLIQEFKLQDELTKNFIIDKPALKKPQIICFDVAQDTSGEYAISL